MKKFTRNIIVYLSLFSLLSIAFMYISSYIVKNRDFKNYETESNTLIINSSEEYDILFLGISHARNFSRHRNHLKIENILTKKIINLGQGGGACGVNEQFFYLKYFYSLNNNTETLIYILSPPLLFSETLPIASNTFNREVFEINFLLSYVFIKSENKFQRINEYIKTKFQRSWLNYKPHSLEEYTDSLTEIDSVIVKQGLDYAYKQGLNFERFNKSRATIIKTIDLAINNKTNVILIIPPALFGKWNGHFETQKFGEEMEKEYPDKVKFFDFSETVLEPTYYYDHHHLNTKGVVYFTENYLKEILSNE